MDKKPYIFFIPHLSGVWDTGALHLIPHLTDDIVDLIVREEVRDLTRGEQVVDQNQEMFVRNLGVTHQENCAQVFYSSFLIQCGQIVLQVRNTVTFSQCHLENFHRGNVGSKSGEGLFA